MPLPFLLPSDQVVERVLDPVHSIIMVDWVIALYDNVRLLGEFTNTKREDIQVNMMMSAGNYTWKWPKHTDCTFYQSRNILKKIIPSDVLCFSFQICRES